MHRQSTSLVVMVAALIMMPACGPNYTAESFSIAKVPAEDCESLTKKKRSLNQEMRMLKRDLFKANREACADLTEYYSLKKASYAVDVEARKVCPPTTFANVRCDLACLDKELAQVGWTKDRFCAKK